MEGHPNANIIGCYNMFEAARINGVKRIIFPSSNHATGFYRRATTIDHRVSEARRPLWRLQGLRRSARQSVCRQYGMEVFCMRIGNVNPVPIDKRRLSIWFSPRDLAQLVTIGIEHPEIRFEIVYGVSRNTRSWYDNSNAYRLGYQPQDDAESYAKEVMESEKPGGDPIAEKYQAGPSPWPRTFRTLHRYRRRRENERPQTQTRNTGRRYRHPHAHLRQRGAIWRPAHRCREISAKDSIERCNSVSACRVIVVQPNAYQDDNRVTLAAIRELAPAPRAWVSSSRTCQMPISLADRVRHHRAAHLPVAGVRSASIACTM